MDDTDRLIAKLRKQFEGSGSFGDPIFVLCDRYEQLRSETLGPPASATQLRECAQQNDAFQAHVTLLEGEMENLRKKAWAANLSSVVGVDSPTHNFPQVVIDTIDAALSRSDAEAPAT